MGYRCSFVLILSLSIAVFTCVTPRICYAELPTEPRLFKVSPPKLPEFRQASTPQTSPIVNPESIDKALSETKEGNNEDVMPQKQAKQEAIDIKVLKRVKSLTKRDDAKGLYSIKLDWKEADKMAMFFFKDHGYMVFNKPGLLSGGTFPNDFFKAAKLIPHKEAMIVRFVLQPNKDVHIARLNGDWVIQVGEMNNEMPSGIYDLDIRVQDDGTTLAIQNSDAEPLIQFSDPDTGEVFAVIPHVSRGIDMTKRNLMHDILPSYQGLAILIKAPDQLVVKEDQANKAILIHRLDDQKLSIVLKDKRVAEQVSSLVDLSKYDMPPAMIQPQQRLLQQRIIEATTQNQRISGEEELAKFYLATGMYYEAAGVLSLIRQRFPAHFYASDRLLVMDDLAQILAHSVDDDNLRTNEGYFEGEPERNLILALHEQRFGRDQISLERFVQAYKFISNLPRIMRNDVVFKAFDAALMTGFKKPIFSDLLDQSLMTKRMLDEYTFDVTKAKQLNNPTERFLETYSRLSFSPNLKVALLAKLAIVDKKKPHLKSLIKELEAIKFKWRGDILEQKLLVTLVDLYLRVGNTREALVCLRTIATYLWKLERNHIYTKRAEDIFYSSFMGMKNRPLLEQLGYYYEFEDITPRGPRYGEILARVTDLYMKVGMVKEAIQVLNQRLDFLRYEKKRKTISKSEYDYLANVTRKRLAEMQYANHQFKESLQTLDSLAEMKEGELTAKQILDLTDDVKKVKAKAYLALAEYDNALAAVEGLDSIPAQRLRADAVLGKQEWLEAFVVLGNLLKEIRDSSEYSQFETDAILDLAVVATHLQDDEINQALINEYADRISDPEKRKAFDIIMASPEPYEMRKQRFQNSLDTAQEYVSTIDNITKDIMASTWKEDGAISDGS